MPAASRADGIEDRLSYDEAGGRYAVLKKGGRPHRDPDEAVRPALGKEVRARSHLVEHPERERRRIAWQLEDTRGLDRGRGR